MAEIIDITTPWEGRTGREVESFIKNRLNSTFGAFYIDASTWTFYFFNSEEDKQKFLDGDTTVEYKSEGLDVSKKMQQVKIINDMESTILYFTTQEEESVITVGFISQEKDFGDENYTEVYENAYFTVEVDKSNTGSYVTVVENKRVINGEKLSVDVKNYLATGQNKVRISCTGEQSGKKDTILFTANVTTMYLKASNFGWHLPFIEGTPFKLGGMLIGGSINKVLNIRVSNENNYSASYKVPLGTATHTINPYDYHDLPFPTEGGTGVYHVEIWLDANGLQSEHLRYNIMCVAAADQHTAQLVVMNSSLNKIVNYDENVVFEYSCYNAGGTTATPYLKLQSIIGTVPTVLVEGSLGTVETAKALSYTYQPEIESWEEGMQLQAILTNGNEQTIIYPIDNSKSYPAVGGASFYLKPASRNNTEDDREVIINQADHSRWEAYWENMSWKDGIDGWTVDESGKKCLFLPAGSKVEMQVQPMKAFTNKTIDLVYKVNHIADYDEPLFSICDDPSSDSFNGIVIYPDKVVVYTNDKKSTLVQSRNFREGVRQHLEIVYANNYKGIGNLVTIYQNGVAQCEFQYETKDLVTNAGTVKMGCDFSNTYIYSMMCYDKALAWPDAVQNWISSLSNSDEKKAAMDAIMKCVDDSFNMSFDAVVASGLDYMTIEMTEGKIPSYVSQASGKCNVELKVKGWWDVVTKFYDIPIEGQGTTAMNYWLWNLRLKLALLEFFAGKWTAKINWASEMQNHKMFGVEAYNELYHTIGLRNEVDGPVAIVQKPVFAFEKKLVDAAAGLYSYEFIGLYTFGPDKGNDAYFKFDDERFADNIIYLEGMDHNVKGAGYDYPYEKMSYKASEEALCNNAGEAALEVRKCGDAESESEIQAKLDEKFKPLYELAYSNNPLIKGTSVSLEEMNADVEAWSRQTDADGHRYERFEFWIDGVYDVLYLDKAENRYKSNGTNLLTQLSLTENDLAGLTIDEKNDVFIKARVERFKASAESLIDVRDYMYKIVICIIIYASDNGIKNTYTYLLAEKWRQLQDDLDSIFKSDNQSLFSKEFWQEMIDFADESKSAYAFKGEHNVLEQLLRAAYPELEKEIAHQVLDAMVSLSPYGDNTIDKLMGYLQSRSWDKAQGYFPKSAYNNFTALAYEGAWPAYIGKSTVSYTVDVNPLSQVVGDSLETEKSFMYFRLIYVMSKYAYGPFANYDDKCLGQITWRTQASQSLTLTPAFPLYPAALSGQTGKRNAERRHMAGESVTFDGLGGSNTNVYIAAADCLEDVGDLSNIIVDSAVDATLQISAKRLKNLKVGDEVSASSNIGRLMLTSTPSLETLDARNLKNLASDVDLSNSPRLREALLAGSVSTGVSLKRGQKIQVLSLPATISSLELLDLPNLTDETLTLEGLGNVTFLRLENCKGVDMFELLKTIYKTEGNKLTNIRIVGFVYDGTAEDLDMLAHFADDTDADGNERTYNGIDADGKTDTLDIPVIEGVLNLDGYVYEDAANVVRANYPNLVFQPLGYYIKFQDPEVFRVLLEKITTDDGVGLTIEDIEKVTSIGTWFKGNKEIVSFDEFEYFTGVKTIYSAWTSQAFGNSSLKYVTLPRGLEATSSTTGYGPFEGCTSLERVTFPTPIANMVGSVFNGCTSLTELRGWDMSVVETLGEAIFSGCTSLVIEDGNFPNLKGTVHRTFEKTKIRKISNLGSITSINNGRYDYGFCFNCKELRSVRLPSSLTSIGSYAFYGCTALAEVIVEAEVPPTLDTTAFTSASNSFVIYVPNDSVAAYKEASNWVAFASRIYPMSTYESGELEQVVTFDDAEVQAVALANWDSDGDGKLQEREILGVTSVARIFKGNANIKKFDDFYKLKNVTSLLGGWQNGAFYNCTGLTSITLPQPLTTMEGYVFQGCTSLNIVNGLENIVTMSAEGCFNGCPLAGISEINMPNLTGSIYKRLFTSMTHPHRINNLGSITAIANTAYSDNIFGSGATFLRLPSTIQSISSYAFRNLTKVEKFVCEAITPPTVSNSFNETTAPIYVPDESVDAYKTADGWTQYADRIMPMSDLEWEEMGNVLTFEDPAVEAIALANWDTDGDGVLSKDEVKAVTGVGTLFSNNTDIVNFDEFKMFTGVTTLGNNAFNGDTALTSIKLPQSVVSLGNYAFHNCTSLASIELPDSITTIGERGFNNCLVLSGDIHLPKLTGISRACFYGAKITSLYAPLATIVNNDAFNGCTELKKVYLEAITNIGGYAFHNCSALEAIVINNVTPPSLVAAALNVSNNCPIYVPDEAVDTYKSASTWSGFASRIKPLSEYIE